MKVGDCGDENVPRKVHPNALQNKNKVHAVAFVDGCAVAVGHFFWSDHSPGATAGTE